MGDETTITNGTKRGFAGLSSLMSDDNCPAVTDFDNAGPDTIKRSLEPLGYAMSGESGRWSVKEPGGALCHFTSIIELRIFAARACAHLKREEDNNGAGPKRGFAGLSSLVSNVEKLENEASRESKAQPPPPPVNQTEAPPSTPQPIYTNASAEPKGRAGMVWAGIGVLAVILIIANNGNKSPAQQYVPPARAYSPSAYTPPAPQPQPTYAPFNGQLDPPAAEPRFGSSTATSSGEEVPPVGGGTLSQSQITYCLSEKIRISAWEPLVDKYSETSVDAFNEGVNAYNSRCGSFRYRESAMAGARRAVEANRSTLHSEGVSRAMMNP